MADLEERIERLQQRVALLESQRRSFLRVPMTDVGREERRSRDMLDIHAGPPDMILSPVDEPRPEKGIGRPVHYYGRFHSMWRSILGQLFG